MDLHLYADEAGCFTFNRNQNVSKYFILCTVTTDDLGLMAALPKLRHKLLWKGEPLGDAFHATADTQAVRDAVYVELAKHDFRVQATICEKSKAQPQVRSSKGRFYQYAWYYHFKHAIAKHVTSGDSLLVTAASIGAKKERDAFTGRLDDVMRQHLAPKCWKVDFRSAMADSYLQIADYCAWAIQRKWERDDRRSYDLIKDRVTYEYDLWKAGSTHHY